MGTARPSDPERLLADARRGSAGCLGSLLELYRNYLHLLARTQIDLHLQSRANPSDLVQETFLEATRDFGDFRGGCGMRLELTIQNFTVTVSRLQR